MKRVVGIALTCLLVATASGHATTVELTKAVNMTINFNSKNVPAPTRKALAIAQLAYWRSFSDRVPRPSPAEIEWLNRELSAGGERQARVVGRREMALYSLSNTGETCIDTYSRLVEAIGKEPKYEAYLWVKTLNCYSSRGDIDIYLKNAGLVGFEIGMLSLWESHIINRVVETILIRE